MAPSLAGVVSPVLNWEATGIGRRVGLSRRSQGRCPPWRPSHKGCPRALHPGSPACPPGPDPSPLPGFPCWKQFVCWDYSTVTSL